jgi:polar amino acid transport system substrate-binding protein
MRVSSRASAGIVRRAPASLLIVAALLLSLLLPAALFAEEEAHGLESAVIIGGDHNYPPYEYLDASGEPRGYNVDLSRAVARVMGINIAFRLGPWGAMRKALAEEEVDILMGMAHTEERDVEVDFSIPHAKVHQSIWVRNGNVTIRTVADLAGREVIVMRGSVMHDFMLERAIDARLFLASTLAEALTLLASGQHDCALVAKLPGEYLLSGLALDNIHPIARPVVAQNYGYAVREGNAELLDRFNEGLALLKKSGEYRRIREQWLGVLQPEEVSWRLLVRYGSLVLGPLLLILVLTVIWSRTLQKQVAVRTEELQREVVERQRAVEELQVRQKQLLHADKMTSLGILVSGVAHEINNPNGLIQLNLPLLQKAYRDAAAILDEHFERQGDFKLGWLDYSRMREEIPHLMQEMLDGSTRIKRIVEDLKDFARRNDAGLDDAVDLNTVVGSALRLVKNTIDKSTKRFRVDYAAGLPPFRGNGHRIEQVVVNLVLNACQALTAADQEIALRIWHEKQLEQVVLEVRDRGCGIDARTLEHITDPFFTTRRETGGTGLGLSVSDGIVKDHLGRLEFTSAEGKGMRVRLYLPVYQEARP